MAGDQVRWIGVATVERYNHHPEALVSAADLRQIDPLILPDDVFVGEPNMLMLGGASALLEFLIGNPGALTPFNAANSYIGVGDGTTAAANTQTDLLGTNKVRKPMVTGYPQHTDSVSAAGAATISFQAQFTTADANFAWNEWAVFNAPTAGRMLNRKQESLGTKTSSSAWTMTVTITLA